jgi:hypothetical protein
MGCRDILVVRDAGFGVMGAADAAAGQTCRHNKRQEV